MANGGDEVSTNEASDEVTAAGVLEKLRAFITTLDPDERALLAALLAPGVANAFSEPDVVGFTAEEIPADWAPNRLPEALAEQIRQQGFTIHIESR